MKLDYDGNLYQIQKQYSFDKANQDEQKIKQVEQALDRLQKEREDLTSRHKQEQKQMMDKLGSVTE